MNIVDLLLNLCEHLFIKMSNQEIKFKTYGATEALSTCFDLRGDRKKTKIAMTRTTINDEKKCKTFLLEEAKKLIDFDMQETQDA
jgi:hypothetical protein